MVMEQTTDLQQNISAVEAAIRFILIIPAGMLGVAAAVYMNTYIFMLLPCYLLITGLTYYSPVKHLYSIIRHKSPHSQSHL
jgi:hypothetical protein